jgi:hypothetical protein
MFSSREEFRNVLAYADPLAIGSLFRGTIPVLSWPTTLFLLSLRLSLDQRSSPGCVAHVPYEICVSDWVRAFQFAHEGCDDLLAFLLLRWTGLRGVDAVKLTCSEVYFDRQEVERVTQKRRKIVIVPTHTELLFALEFEHERVKPHPSNRVLVNPSTGRPMTRPRLYQRMLALGKRAGVPNAHPHRFRDTLAVDMLSRGASPYDVAKMLGDTIETVERHYTPFVKELRERVRNILETGTGIEETAKLPPKSLPNWPRKPS